MSSSAIIFGATGAVGKALLNQLLSSPHHAAVHAFVRRPFKESSVFKSEAKLHEHIISFEDLVKEVDSPDSAENKHVKEIKDVGADAIYITLGTTRAQAGSASNFVMIDREYVLAAAKAALLETQSSSQRLVYCSSAGANSASMLPYLKSKGLTEEGLVKLGYSDCILFRPAFLSGAQRSRTKVVEKIFGSLMTNLGGRISSNIEIQVEDVAKAMSVAGMKGSHELSMSKVGSPFIEESPGKSRNTIINNLEAKRLARTAAML